MSNLRRPCNGPIGENALCTAFLFRYRQTPSPVVTDLPSTTDTPMAPPELVAVLDMGASAIRLVIAEIAPNG